MARIHRYTVDDEIEKRIITGLIVSDEFCTSLQKAIRTEYFQIDYAKIVSKWVLDYYKNYKRSPGKDIENIYKLEKGSLKEADATLIGRFLSNLSSSYEDGFNQEFLLDQSRNYFRERSCRILSDRIQGNLGRGKLDEAEKEIKDYAKVAKELGTWINPFTKSTIRKIFAEENKPLFRMENELGDLTGDLEREMLIAFMGPMKRGKSWMLQELAITALTRKLNVVFFSLEMSQQVLTKRIYQRITGLSSVKGKISWPVFDCERNQDNSCKKPERACTKGVKSPGEVIVEFKEVKGYRPCTACRPVENSEIVNKEYFQAIWRQTRQQAEELDSKAVIKKAKDFERLFGSKLRIKAYPSFTATLQDIISDLDDLWYTEGFAADVICIDSLDITVPEGGMSERGMIDWQWKRAKGLAGERHALVATVLQSNRVSITQKSVQQNNTSEDIRKLAHVDKMFGLNQTPAEKKKGVMRISNVADRHREFQFGKEVIALQCLETGQPILETQWYDEDTEEEKKR